MRAQIMVDVISIVTSTPSLLHHNDVGITYLANFNLRMELMRSIPLGEKPLRCTTLDEKGLVLTVIFFTLYFNHHKK